MPEHQLALFLHALQTNPAIQEKLKQASDREAMAITEIAKEAGFDIPVEELKARGHWWKRLAPRADLSMMDAKKTARESLRLFLERVALDKGLQTTLKAAEGGPDHIAAIANREGYAINADELKIEVFRRWRCGEIK
jgi:predicted ribosomally synthesized peptide with nif11-like leader